MKRINKLAKEHAEQLCESRAAISAAEIDFEAGFRKAREMALNAVYDSDQDPTGFAQDKIREIGEEELE